ncbi:MAG: hypothetical protein HXL29_04150 [Prevotellaceae bacterium]|nr:hypothetical protein [Prevotellaceae bacterium]
MKIDIPVEVEDVLHKALIWATEEFIEEVLDYYSAATVENALREHFKQRLHKNEPLPDFIDPSKL